MGLFDFFKKNRYEEVEDDLADEEYEVDTVVEDTFAAVAAK